MQFYDISRIIITKIEAHKKREERGRERQKGMENVRERKRAK